MKLFLGLYFIELYTLILYLHSLQHKDTTYFLICKILIKKFKSRGLKPLDFFNNFDIIILLIEMAM